MNTETMIRELNAVAEKHKNNFTPTFQTNITAMCRDIIPKLERLAEYEAIGTVEECREARERQRAKKPTLYGDFEDGKLLCLNCEEDLMDLAECGFNCCPYCGQTIDWSDTD